MTPIERHADLMRQGIWKIGATRTVKASKPAPVIRSCDRCRDWHSGSCKSFQVKKAARASQQTT